MSLEKVRPLPPEKKAEVLEFLSELAAGRFPPFRSPKGDCLISTLPSPRGILPRLAVRCGAASRAAMSHDRGWFGSGRGPTGGAGPAYELLCGARSAKGQHNNACLSRIV